MHRELVKLPVILFCAIFVFGGHTSCGCREKKDIRRVVVEGMCNQIIEHPDLSKRTKEMAEKVIGNWNNRVLDREPVLVYAGYALHSDGKYHVLLLDMSDEEFDISAFKVREVRKWEPNVPIIEEGYCVFPQSRIGHPQLVQFDPRQAISQRKNEKDWDAYVNLAPADKLSVYRRRGYPVIRISLPNPPTVEVWISIFDSSGRESEAVPLEHGPRN